MHFCANATANCVSCPPLQTCGVRTAAAQRLDAPGDGGRDRQQPLAATRIKRGTDVDFGALTRAYLLGLQNSGALTVQYGTEVRDLKRLRRTQGDWQLFLSGPSGRREVRSPFVFLGAGGGALPLLQRSGIPEAADFAGFPVSGPEVAGTPAGQRQRAKVAARQRWRPLAGAPSRHALDRWAAPLLFGPFAGFSSSSRVLLICLLSASHQSAADAAGGHHQYRSGEISDQSIAPEPIAA